MKTDMLPQPPPDVNPTAPLVHTHHLIPARCEDLWGLMARAEDVLGVLTLYLSCQSRWKCLGLLMAHTDCHKNLSFTAAPTSKSLETSPVIPRGDEKGEVKREKDKWPPVLLCPDSSLEHPFPKWVDHGEHRGWPQLRLWWDSCNRGQDDDSKLITQCVINLMCLWFLLPLLMSTFMMKCHPTMPAVWWIMKLTRLTPVSALNGSKRRL